ncbi:MAG: TonB-dependent receptor [Cytophagaceae bacterium]|nr:TonB-dependent receptor [Cytophagaceae bacterium]
MKKVLLLGLFLSWNTILVGQFKGVVSNQDGKKIQGALVKLQGTNETSITDSTGAFEFKSESSPPFKISIHLEDFQTQEYTVEKTDGPAQLTFVQKYVVQNEFVVTSRRRAEGAQEIPIPVTVVGGNQIDNAGAFNVNRVKELVPSVQLYSSNPRNTSLSIRGLGSTFGLTNDGLDPGVGFYLDGVYYARPAATTLDFLDLEQIEVLRGPQGTLFGKNTTAGALNLTSRKAGFVPDATFEVSGGNFGFVQAKASVTGPISKTLAARISFSGTQRDGVIKNVRTGKFINDINNQGLRLQIRYMPSEKIDITLAGDISQQRPDGFAQVAAGVAQTQRAAYRQFNAIITDLNYKLPSEDPFDRQVDHDTPWRSNNDLGGSSLNMDFKIGKGTLTSTTAWRYWNWGPSNDRDFTGLQALSLSQAPSKHQQWSQEIRYAGNIAKKISGVLGVFAIDQSLKTDPYHTEESGKDQWRFSQSSTSNLWATPGLFDGYGIRTYSDLFTRSAAIFGQIDWEILKGLHVLPGLRYNYDEKKINYRREAYGGLQTTDPALLALKRQVYSDQQFDARVDDTNLSGNITLSYKASEKVNTFITYSTNFKPIGVNLGGLPTINGQPATDLATIKPESVQHAEWGIKTKPFKSAIVNLVLYNTEIENYQTNVQAAELGVNRGYLANAEKVRVRGVELDANANILKSLSVYGGLALTEAQYIRFANAPLPLEETGAPVSFKDISGGRLPGVSKWAGSVGTEWTKKSEFLGNKGKYFIALESYFRSEFSSSPSPSSYLNIQGYSLWNARAGFRTSKGISIFFWGRNILNQDYFEQLLPAAGNNGLYAAVLGDPRTYGFTLRYSL